MRPDYLDSGKEEQLVSCGFTDKLLLRRKKIGSVEIIDALERFSSMISKCLDFTNSLTLFGKWQINCPITLFFKILQKRAGKSRKYSSRIPKCLFYDQKASINFITDNHNLVMRITRNAQSQDSFYSKDLCYFNTRNNR